MHFTLWSSCRILAFIMSLQSAMFAEDLNISRLPCKLYRNSFLWITMTLVDPSSLEFDMWFKVVQSEKDNHSRLKKRQEKKKKIWLKSVTKNLLVLEAQLFWTAYHVVFDNPLTSTAFWIFQQTNSFLFTDWVSKLNRGRGGHVWDMGLQLAQTYF